MGARTGAKDKSDWIVHGRKPGNPWVIPIGIILMGVLIVMIYQRFMAFDSVTYELRQCQTPLSADSTWEQVQAADCEPIEAAGTQFAIYEGSSRHDPDAVDASKFLFDSFPINSVEHSVEVEFPVTAETVVIAEPENKRIRRALSSVSSDGTRWSGYTGQRGPTHYWVLLTPRP